MQNRGRGGEGRTLVVLLLRAWADGASPPAPLRGEGRTLVVLLLRTWADRASPPALDSVASLPNANARLALLRGEGRTLVVLLLRSGG